MDRISPGRPLRIGIDASCLASRRGYGRFLRELLPPLLECDPESRYVLLADRHTPLELPPLPLEVVRPATAASQAQAASARGHRALGDLWTMGRAAAAARLDLLYFPSVFSWFPVPPGLPVLLGIHDTIPERHGDIVFPTRRTRWLWSAKSWAARRQARALITVSEWSRRCLAERFRIPAERIFVALEAPAADFRPSQETAPARAWLRARGWPEQARYLIYVGGFNPHKNLAGLVDAFAGLGRADPALRLLLVGDYAGDVFHADVPALRERIARAGLAERVHLAGFVDDATLCQLYCGALALVLPSFEEGFGLPAVEAAACGTPCVATRHSPLPELLEGGGLFVDPADGAQLREALARLAGDAELRRALAARALARAGRLSWRATAEATRGALRTVAGAVP